MILPLQRWMQEDRKLRVILGYILIFRYVKHCVTKKIIRIETFWGLSSGGAHL